MGLTMLRLLMTAFLALALQACSAGGVISERPLTGNDEPYQLDSGDQVRVVVFGQEDLTGEYTIDGSGQISMPLVNGIQARGLTIQELEAEVARVLGESLLRNPNVSAQVISFRPFFILGEVTQSGQYPYVNGMTARTAVAIAGGFTYRADQSYVRVTRKRDGKLIELELPMDELIRPGDTVYVTERYF